MVARFADGATKRWELSLFLEQCFVYSIDDSNPVPPQRPINVQTIDKWKVSQASYDPPFQVVVVDNSRESEFRGDGEQTPFTTSPEFLKEVLHDFELPEVVAAWWALQKATSMNIPCPLASSTITMLSFGYWMIVWRSDSTSGKVRAIVLSVNDAYTNDAILANIQGLLEDMPPTIPYHQVAGILAILLCIKIGTHSWAWATNKSVSTYRELQNILTGNNVQ